MPTRSNLIVTHCSYLRMNYKYYFCFQLMSIIFSFEKLLNHEDINIKLFGLKYLINRTVSYFFWPMGTVKK